jgi:AcrR family transcriptional regulator
MAGRRGHPRATSHDAIHAAAIELFHEAGYAETTMPMIAERAGIGRSTLFRYFSSRAEILWHGYADHTEEFRRALADRQEDDPADRAVAAYRSIWADRPERTTIGKRLTRILEDEPPGSTDRWRVYDAWGGLVLADLLERTGRPADDVAVRAAAAAIWAAIWAAVTAFARSDADEIDEHLALARAAIDVRL